MTEKDVRTPCNHLHSPEIESVSILHYISDDKPFTGNLPPNGADTSIATDMESSSSVNDFRLLAFLRKLRSGKRYEHINPDSEHVSQLQLATWKRLCIKRASSLSS